VKINRLIVWSLVLLILLITVGLYAFMSSTGKKPDIFAEIFNEYNIKYLKTAKFPAGGKMVVCGFAARNPRSEVFPRSFLAIYKLGEKGRSMYRFYPVVPAAVDYPRPLILEKVAVIYKNNRPYVVSAWGETGANYFGTHPVVIVLKDGKFRAIPFYPGRLADSPKISRFSWTRKDFTVKNHFDPSDSVQTILTQGVFIKPDGRVELNFYGDEKPHAARHRYVKFIFSLSGL
jgi:hypothetical protein